MDVQRRYWLLAYEGGAWSVAFGLPLPGPLPQLLRGKEWWRARAAGVSRVGEVRQGNLNPGRT